MSVKQHAIETRAAAPGLRPGLEGAGDRGLGWAAVLFTAAVIIHNSDHLRRGADKLTADVFAVGTAGIVLEVGLVILICQRHRLAPLAAAVGGFVLALGYLEVHFLPAHGWLSDSFTSAVHVSPLSWTAASLEVAAAVALAAVGLRVLQRRGGPESASRPYLAQRPVKEGLLHPLALLVIVSQLVTLIVSFVQAYG